MSSKPRVAVIGGGIFGVTAALTLAPFCEVRILERSGALFQGATFANHNRQHLGYHYPRSLETARQCLESHDDFRSFYGDAEFYDFANFYCVAARDSKIDPDQYIAFCEKAGLRYERATPPEGLVDPSRLALTLRVPEGVCNFTVLRELALARLRAAPAIEIRTGHAVLGGRLLAGGAKELVVASGDGARPETYDFVINATYAHYNTFCQWFDFPRRNFQFNLQELNIIELPQPSAVGVTIMDGVFPSMIPMGGTPYHLLAHVNASQLVRESSRHPQPLLSRLSAIESNWAGVLEASIDYLPILHRARYVKSLFVDRVVDADAAATDARLTDLTDHGSGCVSIFAAKVITCVSTAKKLAELIRRQL
jgi:glycine/D-amino acid oxidase-like deaminating enzyme